jgi:E3 ubiquitin-protein ligase MARCH6
MFQFASYIVMLRGILRPGLLWFLKDPSDPNFNAIADLLKRSLSNQIFKLFMAMCLYLGLILGIFGGGVSLILLSDSIVKRFISEKSLFIVFPLRLEY